MNKEKSVDLADLISPKPVKKESPINKYFLDKMTPEERIAWRKRAGEKRSQLKAKQKADKEALMQEARALVPSLIAQELMAEDMDNPQWVPKQDMIDKIKVLMAKGLTIEEMRAKHFRGIKDENWHRIAKFVLKSTVANPEDMGLELRSSYEMSVRMLRSRLREIEAQIRIYKKEKGVKLIPAYLLTMKHEAENRFLAITESVSKTMHQVEAVGEKSKAPVLHVHVGTPRPKQEEKQVVEVSPEKSV
jgi:hypothetical protein